MSGKNGFQARAGQAAPRTACLPTIGLHGDPSPNCCQTALTEWPSHPALGSAASCNCSHPTGGPPTGLKVEGVSKSSSSGTRAQVGIPAVLGIPRVLSPGGGKESVCHLSIGATKLGGQPPKVYGLAHLRIDRSFRCRATLTKHGLRRQCQGASLCLTSDIRLSPPAPATGGGNFTKASLDHVFFSL